MRTSRYCWSACLGAFLVWVAGCAHPRPTHTDSNPTAVPPSRPVSLGLSSDNVTYKTSPSTAASDADTERRAHALASFAAGLVAQEKDSQEESLRYFAQSVAADPSNEALAIDLARRYWVLLQTNRAIDVVRRSAALPDASSEVKSFLGTLYFQARRFPDAMAAFGAAVDKDPQNLGAYQALIPLLIREKRGADARRLLERAGNQSVNDPAYWIDIGSLYALFDETDAKVKAATRDRGLACLHRAEALKPTDPMLLQRLGERYQALNEPVRAEAIFRLSRNGFRSREQLVAVPQHITH